MCTDVPRSERGDSLRWPNVHQDAEVTSDQAGDWNAEIDEGSQGKPLNYRLTWHLGRAELGDEDSWSVTNNLGYLVTVTNGYLTSAALQLAECDDSATERGAWLEELLHDLLGGGAAHAGSWNVNMAHLGRFGVRPPLEHVGVSNFFTGSTKIRTKAR